MSARQFTGLLALIVFMSSNPSEKIYRVHNPSGMDVFRPDLTFDGASEREVEVRESHTLSMVVYKIKLLGLIKVR